MLYTLNGNLKFVERPTIENVAILRLSRSSRCSAIHIISLWSETQQASNDEMIILSKVFTARTSATF